MISVLTKFIHFRMIICY